MDLSYTLPIKENHCFSTDIGPEPSGLLGVGDFAADFSGHVPGVMTGG